MKFAFIFIFSSLVFSINAQYVPKNFSTQDIAKARNWVDSTYNALSQEEKLGQLFIVALYTNKGEEHIEGVRQMVKNDKIGGLILMQENPARHIELVNEFQAMSKIPMLVGMDAEWGVYQRIHKAYKFPWAITLGAIQNKKLIYEMSSKIAMDCKLMGVNWNFAPVVDVNTNPKNPIIGNRSFGSQVNNVSRSALAYSEGLQDSKVLAAIKHFPGHGDTDVDSHLDLPVVAHSIDRLKKIELAPFKTLVDKGIGGVMVAHLYVPSLEPREGVPASVSERVVTGILKNTLGYQGLIITDALNMGAVANKYKAGELDAMAFKAGNDIMLFSQAVSEGKRLIQKEIDNGGISQGRVEESVKKILLTKYYLGLHKNEPQNPLGIEEKLNTPQHKKLVQRLYSNAITLIKNKQKLLPIQKSEVYYYVPLEEADYQVFLDELQKEHQVILKKADEISSIPLNSKVIVGIHKDNSTAYKPYMISDSSKEILYRLAKQHRVILSVFGSPYALRDIEMRKIKSILISYENNEDSQWATAKAMQGKTKITGRLPVEVNKKLKPGMGKNLD